MLKSLFNAISFLTIVKVDVSDSGVLGDLGQSSWAFPVVGALIGLILVIVHSIIHGLTTPFFQAVILVTLWIFLTGGLHMDGWVDCWDSLPAPVSPQDRLRIMKDSRIGTFGAISLISIFLLKVAALSQEHFPTHMLFLAPVAGRTIMLFIAFRAPSAGRGMATALINSLSMRSLVGAALVGFFVVLCSGLLGVIATLVAYAGSVGFKRFAIKRLSVVTGDVIGASCELAECIILAVASIGSHHV